MEPSLKRAYLRLSICRKLGLSTFPKVLGVFNSYGAITSAKDKELLGLGVSNIEIDVLRNAGLSDNEKREYDKALSWEQASKNNLVCYESEFYPPLLRVLDHPPPILYVRGNREVLINRQFAIVGSRKSSVYGGRNAYWMANELSRAGLTISSGMARGIDTFAHRGALTGNGTTIAVMGTGLDSYYPSSNSRLAEEIAEQGALITEFPLGTPPQPQNFPQRNRIISGMSIGTLVVEAAERSGSLITARLALEQNREVFAFPGSINSGLSKGCHSLIKDGAKLVESPTDVLEEFGLNTISTGLNDASPRHKSISLRGSESLTPEQTRIIKIIGDENCILQTLLDGTGLDIQDLNTQLIGLEVAGLIKSRAGRFSCTSRTALHSQKE